MTDECCNEFGCRRKKPFLVRRSSLTHRVYLLTDYTRDGDLIRAKTKHDITDEVNAFIRSESVGVTEEERER